MLRINQRKKAQASVGNAVPGVPWDLIRFHGQPQGLSLRIYCEFVRFHTATVGDGSPVPHKNRSVIFYDFPERRGRRSLQGNCANIERFTRANTVRPYRVADDLCGFFEKTAIICLGSFGKGAARRAEDW